VPRFDQHFLASPETADAIVRAAGLSAGQSVLEIGPGRGAITGLLLDAGARLSAVEIDERLAAGLEERFAGREGFRVVRGDFLELAPEALGDYSKVVANLPYSVATPILQKLLDLPGWRTAVLMFQKEVAQRILAEPGQTGYSLLSLSVQAKAYREWVCGVPKSAFRPPPKVDSGVVRLDRREKPLIPDEVGEEAFFRIARACFAHRRKRAAKSLAMTLGLDKARAEGAFAASGLGKDVRAEEIGLEGFLALARALKA